LKLSSYGAARNRRMAITPHTNNTMATQMNGAEYRPIAAAMKKPAEAVKNKAGT